MKVWHVIGVDRDSGEEKEINLAASSRESACEQANDLGLLVEKCRESESWDKPGLANANAATREQVRLTAGERTTVSLMRGLSALMAAVGIAMVAFGFQPMRLGTGYEPQNFTFLGENTKRFRDDNAHGATANATEYIADNIGRVNTYYSPTSVIGAIIMLAGVVMLIPAELIRQRATLRHYGSHFLAQRDPDHPT